MATKIEKNAEALSRLSDSRLRLSLARDNMNPFSFHPNLNFSRGRCFESSYSNMAQHTNCSIGISCPYTSTFIVSSILVLALPVLNVEISFLSDKILLSIFDE